MPMLSDTPRNTPTISLLPVARVVGSVVLAWLSLACSLAWAGLGDKPISTGGSSPVVLRSLQTVSVASKSTAAAQSYMTQVVTLETGTSVTEYITSSGLVFAVRWDGPVLPDYAQVLGGQAPAFHTALQSSGQVGRRSGAVAVSQNGLVVSSTGHMGRYRGYAYLTALVPEGVDVVALLS